MYRSLNVKTLRVQIDARISLASDVKSLARSRDASSCPMGTHAASLRVSRCDAEIFTAEYSETPSATRKAAGEKTSSEFPAPIKALNGDSPPVLAQKLSSGNGGQSTCAGAEISLIAWAGAGLGMSSARKTGLDMRQRRRQVFERAALRQDLSLRHALSANEAVLGRRRPGFSPVKVRLSMCGACSASLRGVRQGPAERRAAEERPHPRSREARRKHPGDVVPEKRAASDVGASP